MTMVKDIKTSVKGIYKRVYKEKTLYLLRIKRGDVKFSKTFINFNEAVGAKRDYLGESLEIKCANKIYQDFIQKNNVSKYDLHILQEYILKDYIIDPKENNDMAIEMKRGRKSRNCQRDINIVVEIMDRITWDGETIEKAAADLSEKYGLREDTVKKIFYNVLKTSFYLVYPVLQEFIYEKIKPEIEILQNPKFRDYFEEYFNFDRPFINFLPRMCKSPGGRYFFFRPTPIDNNGFPINDQEFTLKEEFLFQNDDSQQE